MDAKAMDNEVDESHDTTREANGTAGIAANATLYQYAFWDKEVAPKRKLLTSLLLLPLLYTTLLMWLCLSIFWGSLVDSNNVGKIKVLVANLDAGNFLGDQIAAGIQNDIATDTNHLDWQIDRSLQSATDCQNAVRDEQAWAILFLPSNASSSLTDALESGTASYNPLDSSTLYYASARNQITVSSHVVPSVLGVINPLLGIAGVKHTAQFLGQAGNNSVVLATASKCPQCLAGPFALKSVDLIPFDSPTAQGSTMVGLIFLLTFTFSIFNILHVTGQVIGDVLRFSSAILFRSVASFLAYFMLALTYTLVNLAFGVPMDRTFGRGGFVLYWLLNTFTMGAVGFPMESLFTLIGLKWAGYFLSFWIIVNVSPAFTSFDSMPTFFQYGYAFPFYHSIQGARTIIFGTKNHLGLNFGILIVWCVIGLLGMYVMTWWRIRGNKRAGVHALV